ncbi:MAG: hypothetical protein SGVNAXEH_000315 [Holophagaceae bacterium]|jgi:enolase
MTLIENIQALEVLDSRGNPTLQVTVYLSDGHSGSAIVPSGASTGSKEALERRDQDPKRYNGKGVLEAVRAVETILAPHLKHQNPFDQKTIDERMIDLDGTPNKSRLGANAILGVSMATSAAAAHASNIPLYRQLRSCESLYLPVPMMNILNGGAHADTNVDIQEFMVIPVAAPNFHEAVRWGAEIYHNLKKVLKKKKLATGVGDEGGFAPRLESNEAALHCIAEAINHSGLRLGQDVYLALDCAASEFYRDGHYHLDQQSWTSEALLRYYESLIRQFPIISIEDGMAEDDHMGWQQLTAALGDKIQLVGDDVFVTNPAILKEGISAHIANALLVKLNQIGTVTETFHAIDVAHQAGYRCIISHRSGESEDTFIADLSLASSAKQIKTGAPARTDRVAKYNRLMQIERELGSQARYAGKEAFSFEVR